MSRRKIKADDFTKMMREALRDYGDAVYDMVEDSAKEVAREATSELKRVSPGNFARTWRHFAQKNGKTSYVEVVHNKDYRRTHLLEKPHDTGKQTGHYPKHPGSKTDHTGKIAAVEEKAVSDYLTKLEKRIEG